MMFFAANGVARNKTGAELWHQGVILYSDQTLITKAGISMRSY